jgi:hypothetical protein
LRFHLSLEHPVLDAPSIGPRTAEQLTRVNVRTVRELLQANPNALAQSLGHRRITGETVRDWQNQARLVCQVPELRGHDARILVACGIRDLSQLSGRSASDLWEIVRPFTETPECKRILRGGEMPTAAEIAAWVRNAQQARPLQAA